MFSLNFIFSYVLRVTFLRLKGLCFFCGLVYFGSLNLLLSVQLGLSFDLSRFVQMVCREFPSLRQGTDHLLERPNGHEGVDQGRQLS